jgi:Peptidase M15
MLIKNPQASRAITSGYRDPQQNGQGTAGVSNSRHMFGDAVDFQNVTRSVEELDLMNEAADRAGATFVEIRGSSWPCANQDKTKGSILPCAHADWHGPNNDDLAH